MAVAPIARGLRRWMRGLPIALLALTPTGCETDSIPVQSAQSAAPPNTATSTWGPDDIDGMWRGWSFPTSLVGYPVELTLEFESIGTAPEDLLLTHYSFPTSGGWTTINYLNYLQEYSLRLEPEGRLLLDTVMTTSNSFGSLIEERIWKDLQISPDGNTLAGVETIQLTSWSGGNPSYQIQSYWLTLERLD